MGQDVRKKSPLREQIESRFGVPEAMPPEWAAFLEFLDDVVDESMLSSDSRLLEALPEVVFEFATDGTILSCRAGDPGDLSHGRARLIGRNVASCPFGTIGEQFLQGIEATATSDEPVGVEYSMPCDNGLASFEARMVRVGERVVATIRNTTRDVSRRAALERSNRDVRNLLDVAETPILLLDPETGRIVESNNFARECYLNSGESLDGESFGKLFIDREEMPRIDRLVRKQETTRVRAAHRLAGGRTAQVEMRLRPVRVEGRELLLSVHKRVEAPAEELTQLRESLSLLEAAFDSTADGILVLDRKHRVVIYNRLFVEMWRLSDEQLVPGREQAAIDVAVEQLKEPQHFLARVDEIQASSEGRTSDILEFADGRFFEVISLPQRVGDRVEGRVWSFRDITDRLQSEERVRYHAFHDVLTGLPNRTLFQDRMEQAIGQSRRAQTQVALLLIDLDRFKTINDTLGHDAGDQLLVEVSKRLLSRRREGDTIARLGGDEFVFLITQLRTREDVVVVAEQVLDVLKPSIEIDEHDLHVSASIGISIFPDDGADGASLMKSADVALYRAKELGRNNYQVYEPKLSERAMERLVMEKDLRRAIHNREFVVQYQPQFSLESGEMTGVEALVRWQRSGKMVPPDRFIPIAEECGLVVPLGRWVLREAAEQCAQFNEELERPLRLCVNLSALQIQRPNFANEVSQLLHEAGFPLNHLVLELTESALMNHPELGSWAMSQLQEMGVGIALDDFGTGHSSLSNVSHLPISMIKIDKAFVRDCANRSTDEAIISAIITMGHALDLKVLAEGVEDEAQVRILRRHGCNEVQGYLYGKPMSADDLVERLRAGDSIPVAIPDEESA